MIFKYTGTEESKRELRKLLDEIRRRDGAVNTFSIARMQGMQMGHKMLLDFSEEIGDKNTLALGSCQESGTLANPYTPSQRIETIRLCKGYDKRFSGKLSIIKLKDIEAVDVTEWREYALEKVANWSGNLPRPNVYIGGSELDIQDNGFHNCEDILAISLERLQSGIMSGTEVRKSIANGNDIWRDHVPYVIQDYLLENFPEELTLKYRIENQG